MQEVLGEDQAVNFFARIPSHSLPPLGPEGMKFLQDPVKGQVTTIQATILPPAADSSSSAAQSSKSVQADEGKEVKIVYYIHD